MKTKNLETKKESEQSVELCKTHKRKIEFICSNSKCKGYRQGCCSKCFQQKQTHENCEVDEILEDCLADKKQRKQLQSDFEFQMNDFMKNLNAFFAKGKYIIFGQIELGNEAVIQTSNHLIELIKEMNQIEIEEFQDKSALIGNIWQRFSALSDLFSDTRTSNNQSLLTVQNCSLSVSHNKSMFSILDQSFMSQQEDVSTPSIISNSSSKRQANQFVNRTDQEIISNLHLQASLNQSSFMQQPSLKLNSVSQRFVKQRNQAKQISLGDFKFTDYQKVQIKSQYIENFILFETTYDADQQSNSFMMQRQLEINTSSVQQVKRYFLLTRSERQSMQIFDLQKMIQLHTIQFTNSNEIIHFKQISNTQVIIFSPNNKFIQVQNIFNEKEFFQIDYKFSIDCIECDRNQELIFLGHTLGKISVQSLKNQQMILENIKIHSTKINMMDYSTGRLVTCCSSESVKEFVLHLNVPELRQKQVLRKELISDCQLESITQIKIINDSTIMVQAEDEIEIYKNGKKENQEILEFITCFNDMKIYDKRFGIVRSPEDENIALIFHFVNFQFTKKNIKLFNADLTVIGAYFINNQIIIFLKNELIFKYF